jgi:glyoxylase-like metal-dependent hydrolase (beta-lactamase superfamily II)
MYGFSDQLKDMPLTRLRALRQGSSRYSTPMPDSIERTFGGLRRITMPLPTRPGHVHTYLLEDGTLVDTGLGLPDATERWRAALGDTEVARVVVTHFHPDHVGAAADVAALTGAPVFQGALDYEQCVHVWGNPEWPTRIADWFLEHGAPQSVADDLVQQGSVYRPFIRFARDPRPLAEGDRVGDWDVIALPGHADGHLGLLSDGALIAGDHLLPRISPAVGLWPDSRPDPLGDYLDSLRRTIELAPRVAYGGHGEPIEDPPARARQLIEHHRVRLDATAAALAEGLRTAYDVSFALFGAELTPAARRFAVAESLSHLERLALEGRAARGRNDRIVTYTAA